MYRMSRPVKMRIRPRVVGDPGVNQKRSQARQPSRSLFWSPPPARLAIGTECEEAVFMVASLALGVESNASRSLLLAVADVTFLQLVRIAGVDGDAVEEFVARLRVAVDEQGDPFGAVVGWYVGHRDVPVQEGVFRVQQVSVGVELAQVDRRVKSR